VVGRTLYLNGYPFSVAGVAREGFLGMTVVAPDVWVPASMIAALNPESGGRLLATRGADWMMLGGRLKRGVSRAQASADIAFTYLASPDFQLDLGANVGVNSVTPDRQIYAGFSYRW